MHVFRAYYHPPRPSTAISATALDIRFYIYALNWAFSISTRYVGLEAKKKKKKRELSVGLRRF